MIKLREIIEEAQNQLDIFKYPDVKECQEKLNEILKAGGLGEIIYDKLENLKYYDGFLEITTSYSVRCCNQTGEYKIPEKVIDADDPILAIKEWKYHEEFKKAQREVEMAKCQLKHAQEILTNLEVKYPKW